MVHVHIFLCLLMVLTDYANDFLRIVWQMEDIYFTNDVCIEMCYCDSSFLFTGICRMELE